MNRWTLCVTAVLLSVWPRMNSLAEETIPVAREAVVDGMVLELVSPMEGAVLELTWVAADGRVFRHELVLRAGAHAYEMRRVPGWVGNVQRVELPAGCGVSGRLLRPSLWAEWDIFLAPEQRLFSSVNFLWGHTLFGFPWERLLLVGIVLGTLAGVLGRRWGFRRSLGVCLLLAWVLTDLRSTWDDVEVVRGSATNETLKRVRYLEAVAQNAAREIGSDGTWSTEGLGVVDDGVVSYGLAEHRYAPYGQGRARHYVVTVKEGNYVLRSEKAK